MKKETIIISFCLFDIPCQYDGELAKRRFSPSMIDKINFKYHIVPICPEQLSGLCTPRKPVEIQFGDGLDVLNLRTKVINESGEDFTDYFIKGANLTLKIAKLLNATKMITQKRSPTCSSSGIYDGTFSHTLVKGYGVCAALLKMNGIELIDIDEVEE